MTNSNDFPDEQKVKLLKTAYPKGTKVKLCKMVGEDQMEFGLVGTVTHVDDAGQIHVNWENGSSLALQGHDIFSVINE